MLWHWETEHLSLSKCRYCFQDIFEVFPILLYNIMQISKGVKQGGITQQTSLTNSLNIFFCLVLCYKWKIFQKLLVCLFAFPTWPIFFSSRGTVGQVILLVHSGGLPERPHVMRDHLQGKLFLFILVLISDQVLFCHWILSCVQDVGFV